MRFQNWDVLVFPYEECKIPLQEFKTSCQVIQDPEVHPFQTQPFLLPTVTTFVPALSAGAPFRISVHCWENPELSRYLQAANKFGKTAKFEARVFVDGRLAGRRDLDRDGPWPSIIETSIDPDKHGDVERLKFPPFHRELLSQSYWNAGDDLGRIKVVIAEGFHHDGVLGTFDRVKNVVSFSFQHAPLDLLEASTIAWPNAAMWRQVPVVTTYYAQVQSPQPTLGDADTHHHSPRRIQNASRHGSNLALSGGNPMPPPTIPAYIRQANHDPFVDSTSQAFNLWRQPSSDVSMPDYSKSNSRASSMRNITDTATMPDISGRQFASLQELGAYESVCEALSPAVPAAPSQRKGDGVSTPVMTVRKPSANTRPVGADIIQNIHPFQASTTFLEPVNAGQQDLPEKAERNRNSPSTMDATNIKSRKENVPKTLFEENPQAQDKGLRKVAQPFSASNITGTKRQRVITPAASKVIDHEDQPRVSPIARKLSRQDARDGRSVLGGIENI